MAVLEEQFEEQQEIVSISKGTKCIHPGKGMRLCRPLL